MFLLENVSRLLTSPDWDTILKSLESVLDPCTGEAAYTINFQVLNPTSFGYCQSRRRLYIVGRHRRKMGKQSAVSFPWPRGDKPPSDSELAPDMSLSRVLLPESQIRKIEPQCYRPLTECSSENCDVIMKRLLAKGIRWSARAPHLIHPHVSASRVRDNKPGITW